jgi:recombinational DNA repair protein (RecF pathway)
MEMGILTAIAKNARKSIKRFGGGLLDPARAAYYYFKIRNHRDLCLVERGEDNPKAPILPNLPLIHALASWALELVLAFEMPFNPSLDAFNLLVRHLKDLSDPLPTEPPALEARTASLVFTHHYLKKTGFAPNFQCHFCGKVPSVELEDLPWSWDFIAPKIICPDCLKIRGIVAPRVPLGLLVALKKLPFPMRPVFPLPDDWLTLAEHYYGDLVETITGRSLKSRKVIEELNRLS